MTSGGIDWQREKWQSGLGSKFIHQGEKNAAKYADEIRLTYEADLPARSGLGTSSSFAVGMLNAFYALKGKYGTSSVGEYCNIIGSTCLGSKNGGNGPTLGDHCELGMNSVVIGNVQIGNNVYIGAGAVVTKSFKQDGVSLAGVPAKVVSHFKIDESSN